MVGTFLHAVRESTGCGRCPLFGDNGEAVVPVGDGVCCHPVWPTQEDYLLGRVVPDADTVPAWCPLRDGPLMVTLSPQPDAADAGKQ